MTLTPPKHLRGRMGKNNAARKAKRGEWIMQMHRAGHPFDEIALALGIRYTTVLEAAKLAGYRRVSKQRLDTLQTQGIRLGKSSAAYDSLSIPARTALANTSARQGKPLLHVMADFWERHHGAQA